MSEAPITDHVQRYFNDAQRHLEQGRHSAAAEACLRVIDLDHEHTPSLHMLGVLAMQRQDWETASRVLGHAANTPGATPVLHLDLGVALHESGDLPRAQISLRKAVRTAPRFAQAHFQLACCLSDAGELNQALLSFAKALELDPGLAELHFRMGLTLHTKGEFKAAADCYREELRINPRHSEALCNLGALHHRADELSQAMQAFRQATKIAPGNLTAWLNRGNVAAQMQRTDEACRSLHHAASLFEGSGAPDKAEEVYRRILDLQPEDGAAWNDLGILLAEQGRDSDAEHCFRHALQHRKQAQIMTNLGNALARQRHLEEAVTQYRAALTQDPNIASTWTNLGLTLADQGETDEALTAFTRAGELAPDDPEPRYFRSTLQLSLGRLSEGWSEYRWRMPLLTGRAYLPHPLDPQTSLPFPEHWCHEDLAGRHLLVRHDQGLGDELFFLRFVPQLQARGIRLSYVASPKLHELLAASASLSLCSVEQIPEDWDHALAVGDLPLLAHDGEPTPAPLPLQPNGERQAKARETLLAMGTGPYLALTWRAGTAARGLLQKQIPLEQLAEALRAWPGSLVSVQRNPQEGELDRLADLLGRPVHDLSHWNEDLQDMLALMATVDEYVTVSNTNLHLRASCGRRAQVLIPEPGEWRWMRSGESSPWFPGFDLHRQQGDDWQPALQSLRECLTRAAY